MAKGCEAREGTKGRQREQERRGSRRKKGLSDVCVWEEKERWEGREERKGRATNSADRCFDH